MMRRCASAVVCRRSIASVAKRPRCRSRSSSSCRRCRCRWSSGRRRAGCRARQNWCAIASVPSPPIDDERVEAHLVEHLDDAVRVVVRAVRRLRSGCERVAAVDGAEDGAAEAQDAGDVARREQARAVGLDQPVEAVLDAEHSMPQLAADLTTARMTAFRPGASPPPVSTPMRLSGRHDSTIANAACTRCERGNSRVRLMVRLSGRLAQLGERRVRNAEVGSSSLLPSTTFLPLQAPVQGPSTSFRTTIAMVGWTTVECYVLPRK